MVIWGKMILAEGSAKTEKGPCVERVTRLELAGRKVEGSGRLLSSRLCRVLETKIRTWEFIPMVMGSHWKILSTRVTWSDFFQRLSVIVWRDCKDGTGVEAWRPIRNHALVWVADGWVGGVALQWKLVGKVLGWRGSQLGEIFSPHEMCGNV